MTHLHKASGLYFECGELMDFPVKAVRKTYDMTVITLWGCTEGDPDSPIIIGFYFGEYDEETTNYYIDRWLEKQSTNNMWRKFVSDVKGIVDAYWLTNYEVLEEPYKTKVQTIRTGLENLMEVNQHENI